MSTRWEKPVSGLESSPVSSDNEPICLCSLVSRDSQGRRSPSPLPGAGAEEPGDPRAGQVRSPIPEDEKVRDAEKLVRLMADVRDGGVPMKPDAGKQAENFLTKRIDDPRRNLSDGDRKVLKDMERAVLSGDIAKLEKIVQSYDGDREKLRELVTAMGTDLKEAGLFVNYYGVFGGGKNSYYLDIANLNTGTSVLVSTAGEKTEAKVNNKEAKAQDALKQLGKDATDNIGQLLSKPAQKDAALDALFEQWKKVHDKTTAKEEKTFQAPNGDRITDNGDGTCTVKGDKDFKGTVKKDAKTGEVVYSYGDGIKVTKGVDGKLTSFRPATKDDPESTSISYPSGLKIREEDGRRLTLPNGVVVTEDKDGTAEFRDQYGPHKGKATKLKDGSVEYFFDDGRTIYNVKPTGEVTLNSGDATTSWAADGAMCRREKGSLTMKDKLKSEKDKETYTSHDGFKLERSKDGLRVETESGVREFDERGNLTVTTKEGKKEYKAADAKKVTYGFGSITELEYDDGTCLTVAGKDVYVSVPTGKDQWQHAWIRGGDSDIYYQTSRRGHYNPNYHPKNYME